MINSTIKFRVDLIDSMEIEFNDQKTMLWTRMLKDNITLLPLTLNYIHRIGYLELNWVKYVTIYNIFQTDHCRVDLVGDMMYITMEGMI